MSHIPTTKQLQRITGQVFALLSENGDFPRMVFDMSNKELPDGPGIAYKLIKKHRFDAVRCEIMGVTLTVEITTERQGIQDEESDETQLVYATSSYELFRRWLFKILTDAGVTPKYPDYVAPMVQPNQRPGTIKTNPGKFVHHPKRNKRR